MATITAADVKKLRDLTGAGMMECKKALEESDGDIDKAIESLRKASELATNPDEKQHVENALADLEAGRLQGRGILVPSAA